MGTRYSAASGNTLYAIFAQLGVFVARAERSGGPAAPTPDELPRVPDRLDKMPCGNRDTK
jgi:hypothetical protein